jgi:hypothetical protein
MAACRSESTAKEVSGPWIKRHVCPTASALEKPYKSTHPWLTCKPGCVGAIGAMSERMPAAPSPTDTLTQTRMTPRRLTHRQDGKRWCRSCQDARLLGRCGALRRHGRPRGLGHERAAHCSGARSRRCDCCVQGHRGSSACAHTTRGGSLPAGQGANAPPPRRAAARRRGAHTHPRRRRVWRGLWRPAASLQSLTLMEPP